MGKFTAEERAALYDLFTLGEHEIREGATSKDKGKIQFFVYVRREAIQQRLDTLFFGEWELYFLNPENPCIYHANHVDCSMGLSIRGIRREYNGSQDGGGLNGAKGAATDAFKRVASMWGLGLYLQNAPQVWVENYVSYDGNGKKISTDWKKKDAVEKQAMDKVAQWLKSIGASGNALFASNENSEENGQNEALDRLSPEAHGLGQDSNTIKPIHENILKAVKTLTKPLYGGNSPHQDNSLKGLEQNGMIHGGMLASEIAGAVFLHRVAKDFGFDESEVVQICKKHPNDFLQNADAFKKAYQVVKTAHDN